MHVKILAILRAIIAIVISICSVTIVYSVPARRQYITVKQADGTELRVMPVGDERFHYYLSEDGYPLINKEDTYYYVDINAYGEVICTSIKAQSGLIRNSKSATLLANINPTVVKTALDKMAENARIGLFDTSFPIQGEPHVLVVIVEYQDVSFTCDNPYDHFYRMLNEKGYSDYGATGSAYDYFNESSDGKFHPIFDVYGPITLSNSIKYYGANDAYGDDKQPYMMAIEACQQLDDTIDFTQYDCDNDGKIDLCYVFYAGNGEASGGNSYTVWPHSWTLSEAIGAEYRFDGILLDSYACSNEWEVYSTMPAGIGSFIHEFSHVLGLPDLYSTTYSNAFTPGEWTVLDQGTYNNNGRTPPTYSIYERYSLGWLQPKLINKEACDISLRDISYNEGAMISTGNDNEFFLFENRQQIGWDEYLPGHGMLVWHIDYNIDIWNANTVNNSASHQYVDIEEADGKLTESTRSGDAFPGTDTITSFTDNTSPSMRTWAGDALNLPITDIEETDGVIRFKVLGGTPESISQTHESKNEHEKNRIVFNKTSRLLNIETPIGEYIALWDTEGKMLYDIISNKVNTTFFVPNKGIYILSVGKQAYKIMVK